MKNIKKTTLKLAFLLACGLYLGGFSSCKTGEGCPGSEYEVGTEIEQHNGKRGKSGLFSKKEKKKNGR